MVLQRSAVSISAALHLEATCVSLSGMPGLSGDTCLNDL